MLSIDSRLWSIRAYNAAYAYITQRASGTIRAVPRALLPSDEDPAVMSETQFNGLCRELFHNAALR